MKQPKYLFYFSGYVTTSDKTRGTEIGEDDIQAVISTDTEDPRNSCSLNSPVFISKLLLNSDW
jgi:hypothetical protein